MKRFKEYINELFDNPVKLNYLTRVPAQSVAVFHVDGTEYRIEATMIRTQERMLVKNAKYYVSFASIDDVGDLNYDKTDFGTDTAVTVLSTVMKFILDLVKKYNPKVITFTAYKDGKREDSRASLYTAMVKKFVPDEYAIDINQKGYDKSSFTLTRKK